MGKKKTAVRVVLDTNILVSALIFRGRLSGVADLWKRKIIIPLVSRETFEEFLAVLEYPKFSLDEAEKKAIVQEEVLPYFEVVEKPGPVENICRDPEDDKFLALAVSGKAEYLVSGDDDLCGMKKDRGTKILSATEFLKLFK
jgi:putative PIN family toxin of toxin-antitoxin system